MARGNIDIKKQPAMSLERTANLTFNGIRYRLFRSSVTVLVITVAIAFLMNGLSESLVKKGVAAGARARIAELRLVTNVVARLSGAGTTEDLVTALARAPQGSAEYEELLRFGQLTAAEWPAAQQQAARAARYLDFFAQLSYGYRRQLVHNAQGVEIFDRLQQPEARERFGSALPRLTSVRFVTTVAEFDDFLRQWPPLAAQLRRVQAGRLAAVKAIDQTLGGESLLDALARADGEFGATVRQAGFELSPEAAAVVARQAHDLKQQRVLEKTIAKVSLRQEVASHLDVLPTEVTVTVLWQMLGNRTEAAWYLGKLRELELDAGVSVDEALALAARKQEIDALLRMDRLVGEAGSGFLGIGPRMTWLLLVSLVVCVVGIANAMLMTVTERFREIATLKCLGALDSFIMLMFVLEACVLGVVGGTFGAALGLVIGIGRATATFGLRTLANVPWGSLAGAAALAVALGVVLAAVAAVYPSLKAAQLAPMEAMRIE